MCEDDHGRILDLMDNKKQKLFANCKICPLVSFVDVETIIGNLRKQATVSTDLNRYSFRSHLFVIVKVDMEDRSSFQRSQLKIAVLCRISKSTVRDFK